MKTAQAAGVTVPILRAPAFGALPSPAPCCFTTRGVPLENLLPINAFWQAELNRSGPGSPRDLGEACQAKMKGRKACPLAGRIKKLMQADDDVGKIAQATPVLLGKHSALSSAHPWHGQSQPTGHLPKHSAST